jgi:tripartite-type tricarboxylate transporter receptor subunit TctC
VLVLTSERRLAAMPDIATASEQGYPELIARLFVGLFAPAKTPRQILAKLEAVTQSALQDPALQAKFAAGGFETLTSSDAAAAASYINKEVARWKPLLKQFSLNQQ